MHSNMEKDGGFLSHQGSSSFQSQVLKDFFSAAAQVLKPLITPETAWGTRRPVTLVTTTSTLLWKKTGKAPADQPTDMFLFGLTMIGFCI